MDALTALMDAPWRLPQWVDLADAYQRDAIAEAQATRPDDELQEDLG